MLDEISFYLPLRYGDDSLSSHEEIKLPWVEGQSLKLYYAATRFTKHLGAKNMRMTVRKVPDRTPVRSSYVPRSGEAFVFTSARR